eukprot:TRINITY_DN69190_c0_g1_i1.p1 TRINITY_DN69190_c0_g1~~TRINITY_DN69190_c0_g1_i1.p1  ORF type:complete len:570 (+),score=84.55 TRINITY_DN69190_c0_g1_i1:25-1734(+)
MAVVDSTMPVYPLLLSTLLDRGSRIDPGQEIVTKTRHGYHVITFADHQKRAYQLAHALRAAGVNYLGCPVGTFMFNSTRHLHLYHAVPSIGAVLHTLNVRLSVEEVHYIITHAGDHILFVDAELLPIIDKVYVMGLDCVKRFVICGADCQSGAWQPPAHIPASKLVDFEAFIAPHPEFFQWPTFSDTAGAALCYTSGTTGKPKGVCYSHRSTYLHTLTASLPDTLSLSHSDCMLTIVPMFHANAWGLPFCALMLGMKICFPHHYMAPEQLLDFLSDHRVTCSGCVPTVFQALREALTEYPDRWDLTHLRRMTCGGSAPPFELMKWYQEKHNIEFIQGWGMTEINPLGTISRMVNRASDRKLSRDEQYRHLRKAGLPLPGLKVKLANPDNYQEEFPADGNAVGELLIQGPWVTQRYLKNENPEKFHDGWLATGDMARLEPDNYISITDRSKDLIKSGGEWISSIDMENCVAQMDSVQQCAVVGVPHPKWDERPVCIVVPATKGEAPGLGEVHRHLLEHGFSKFQLPDDILEWEAIPVTSVGKFDKKRMRGLLQEQGYELPTNPHPHHSKL